MRRCHLNRDGFTIWRYDWALRIGREWEWQDGWSIQYASGFMPERPLGEIPWRYYWRWRIESPIAIRLIYRRSLPRNTTGGEWLSRRWTGRDRSIIGLLVRTGFGYKQRWHQFGGRAELQGE